MATTVRSNQAPPPLFREVQRFRQVWLWAILVGCAVLSVAPLLCIESPAGRATMLGSALLACGLLVWFWVMALVVEVEGGEVRVRFRGLFVDRRIALDEVEAFWARRYRPVREYGGWGVRGLGKNRAYNVSGDYGVQLLLADGRRVLLGSQRAADLEEAIARASGRPAQER